MHFFVKKRFDSTLYILLFAGIHRIIRAWNQTGRKKRNILITGNKWLGGPDYAKWLTYPGRENIMYSIFLVSLMFISSFALLFSKTREEKVGKYVQFLLSLLIFKRTKLFQVSCFLTTLFVALYKMDISVGISRLYIARFAYTFFFGMILSLTKRNGIHPLQLLSSFSLLVILLHRLQNTAIIALTFVQVLLFSQVNKDLPPWVNYMILLWAGKSAYFAFGNSNSLATIDISGAYTGLGELFAW